MNNNNLSAHRFKDEEREQAVVHATQLAAATEKKLRSVSYRFPPEYMPWNSLRDMLVSFVWAGVRRIDGTLDAELSGVDWATYHNASVIGDALSAYDCPFFLVGSALLEELSHTDALEGLSVEHDAPLPFPAFVLVPPLGALPLPADGNEDGVVASALYVTYDNGRLVVVVQAEGVIDKQVRLVCMDIFLTDDGVIVTDAEEIAARHLKRHGKIYAAAEYVGVVAQMISNVLAVMAAEPELVEGSSVISTVRKHGGKVTKRFMSPRWVGRSVKRSYTPEAGEAGSSLKPHWRRGYVRRQRYGPGRQLTKIVRIRPVRVNSQKEVEAVN